MYILYRVAFNPVSVAFHKVINFGGTNFIINFITTSFVVMLRVVVAGPALCGVAGGQCAVVHCFLVMDVPRHQCGECQELLPQPHSQSLGPLVLYQPVYWQLAVLLCSPMSR